MYAPKSKLESSIPNSQLNLPELSARANEAKVAKQVEQSLDKFIPAHAVHATEQVLLDALAPQLPPGQDARDAASRTLNYRGILSAACRAEFDAEHFRALESPELNFVRRLMVEQLPTLAARGLAAGLAPRSPLSPRPAPAPAHGGGQLKVVDRPAHLERAEALCDLIVAPRQLIGLHPQLRRQICEELATLPYTDIISLASFTGIIPPPAPRLEAGQSAAARQRAEATRRANAARDRQHRDLSERWGRVSATMLGVHLQLLGDTPQTSVVGRKRVSFQVPQDTGPSTSRRLKKTPRPALGELLPPYVANTPRHQAAFNLAKVYDRLHRNPQQLARMWDRVADPSLIPPADDCFLARLQASSMQLARSQFTD